MQEIHEPALTLALHVDDLEIGHHLDGALAKTDHQIQHEVQPGRAPAHEEEHADRDEQKTGYQHPPRGKPLHEKSAEKGREEVADGACGQYHPREGVRPMECADDLGERRTDYGEEDPEDRKARKIKDIQAPCLAVE